MINLLRITPRDSKTVSDLINPFNKDKIKSITIEISRNTYSWNQNKPIEITIYFGDNKTSGRHSLLAETLEEAVSKIKNTIDSL